METVEISAKIANAMAKSVVKNLIDSLRQDIITAANDGNFEISMGYIQGNTPEVIAFYEEKGFKIFKKEENGSQRTYISWKSK